MKTAKMHRISQLSALRKAGRWNLVGTKWHFHLLSQHCLFNHFKSDALILESAQGGNFYSLSNQRHLHVGKQLLNLLLSSKTLAYSPAHSQGKVSKILARAKHLMKKGIPWHNHLLFPQCVYNQRPGKWVLAFEDPLEHDLIEVIYPHFPGKDLAEIDKLFYKQRK